MAPRAIEAEIDRLYRLPPEEFTAARNALAKGAGADAARIKALTKPPIGAWAVNQLHWEDADTWNALIAASENARRAHRAVLSGKTADVRAANKVHDEAADRALKATLAILGKADHTATDATRHAIGTTLRALPADEAPGRLTKMLQPAGFETLAGLSVMAAAAPPARAASPAPERPTRSKTDVKAMTQGRQEAAAAARALRDAENAARREEFERVRTEREETRAADAVEKAREAAARAAEDVEQAEAAATRAVDARKQAAARARQAQQDLAAARKHAEAAAKQVAALEKTAGGRR